VVGAGGFVQHEALLAWLQQYVEDADVETWQAYWPALSQIARLLMVPEDGETGDIEAERWRLLLGPVDLTGDIVTIARRDYLVAALAPTEDGTLKAAHYRPLDARAASLLTAAGLRPLPDGTVGLRPNGFEYMKDQTASMGQAYAWDAGRAYLSYWPNGLGIRQDGTAWPEWLDQQRLTPLDWRQLAAELASHALYGDALATWEDTAVSVRPLAASLTAAQD
jgi:hypothetical protein